MSINRERMREIFDQARRLPGRERSAFLSGLATIDAPMRAQIEDMLAALDEAGAFLSEPTQVHGDAPATTDTASAGVTVVVPLREGPGTHIGHYKLLQLIGEGGFGSVFMAEQEKPVARKVALKIIKLGMDTGQVVARFEQERQALAMMEHPNIAKVFDAGATETGRPFFVMELVKGDPIAEYCDKNNLSIEQRLELFAQVCNAVQHAHTKGIIHRDIKPSNILVSTQDGRPHTKVIDFGIAKATASKLTEKTLFTEHKALIGTPEYMSPEQAEGSLDIDTRTDVYSLGVLLYELLTGTTPFSGKELRSAAYAEIQRIIREVEPPKPSTRLSANTDTIASVAAKRHTDPERLGTIVRGELDWIVMKALEKDRHRRYETANGLMMDIQRYLSGEAVLAAPPSKAYRLKKFVRRNRLVVLAGSAVVVTLLIGGVATGLALARALGAEKELRGQFIETDQARQTAQRQAAIAEAVARFQTDMLASADPGHLLGDKVTVLQAMRGAVDQLDSGSLKDQPLVEASVREMIGQTLRQLASFKDSELNLRRSLSIRRAVLPPGEIAIASSLNSLASLLRGLNNPAEAESLFVEAADILRKATPAGEIELARNRNDFALLLLDLQRLPEAEPLFRQAVELYRKAGYEGRAESADCLNNLALLLMNSERAVDGEKLARQALAVYRTALPAGHPRIANALSNLGAQLLAQEQAAAAEPLCREALEIYRKVLPEGHPEIAWVLTNVAACLQGQRKLSEAEPFLREAVEVHRKALPAGHPDIARDLSNLTTLLREDRRPAEAEPVGREALAIVRSALPEGHPGVVAVLVNLALVHQDLARPAEARAGFDEAIAILRKGPAGGSARFARVLWRSGSARLENKNGGDAAAALPELEEAVATAEKLLPAEHPHLKEYRETLVKCKLARAGQPLR